MAGSVNRVILVGNLGADPEVAAMQNGKPVCKFSMATTESWRDKEGNRQERTTWHRIVIFSEGLVRIAQQYLRKGSKIYLEGQLQTRSYEKDGQTHYVTEVVLQGFNSALTMLDSARDGGNTDTAPSGGGGADLDDEVPF